MCLASQSCVSREDVLMCFYEKSSRRNYWAVEFIFCVEHLKILCVVCEEQKNEFDEVKKRKKIKEIRKWVYFLRLIHSLQTFSNREEPHGQDKCSRGDKTKIDELILSDFFLELIEPVDDAWERTFWWTNLPVLPPSLAQSNAQWLGLKWIFPKQSRAASESGSALSVGIRCISQHTNGGCRPKACPWKQL